MLSLRSLACLLLLATTLPSPAFADSLAEVNARIEARAPAALATAEAFAKANAANAEAWIALTRARLQAGKAEPAVTAAQKATQLGPNNAQAHYWLGNAYGSRIGQVSMLSKMGLAPKLRDAFERAVALDGNLLEARSALIEFYLQAPAMMGGGVDKARMQAVEIGKRDKAQGFMAHGRIAMHEKKPADALKFYEAALVTRPGDSRIRLAVALAYQQLERWADAFKLLRAWTAETPGAGAAWYQMGRAAALSGQYADEGVAALQTYLKMAHGRDEPENKHAYYRLGQIQAKAGRKDQARLALQAALKLDPKFAEAKAELGKL